MARSIYVSMQKSSAIRDFADMHKCYLNEFFESREEAEDYCEENYKVVELVVMTVSEYNELIKRG